LILLNIEALRRERERERGVRLGHIYNNIISVENLLLAWREFLNGKRKRKDVEKFSINLTDNILELHYDLKGKRYKHGPYTAFKINDPKPREINKATVRDRLLHHAIYRVLYPFFDRKFIFDSYSCRYLKGTHKAINRFRKYVRKVSKNSTKTVWILKCDIKKFFANIDHTILINILAKRLKDRHTVLLISEIIKSFNTENRQGIGLPLGNLTSQLLVNIYMNEFDHFVKRELEAKYYIRYADDFVILNSNKRSLEKLLPQISLYLETRLRLSLHPGKVSLKTIYSGEDFLGWVHFPQHRVLRTSTKKRMFKRIRKNHTEKVVASYMGLLSHGNGYKLKKRL
jgi:RNA-directed DNA polymerase